MLRHYLAFAARQLARSPLATAIAVGGLGLGLAAAILIDVTIIRALLVPSAMKLFGRWNWWLPEGAAKIFRVKPSPLDGGAAPALRPAGR